MKVGVVGSSGVVGGIICEHLLLTGHDVIRYSRQKKSGVEFLDVLDLNLKPNFSDLDLIVYCSWSTNDRSKDCQQAHAQAARHWAKHARDQKCMFLFLSSVLADESAKSNYGIYKQLAESGVEEFGGKSLRIGLVADDAYELLLTKLRRIDRKISVIHRFCDFQVYAISTASFNNCLLEVLEKWPPGEVFWVAPVRAESLMRLIRPSGTTKVGKYSLFRQLPRIVARFPTGKGKLGSHIDGVKGLLGQNADPVKQSWIMPVKIDDSDWKLNLYL
jgi:hypothetical protein